MIADSVLNVCFHGNLWLRDCRRISGSAARPIRAAGLRWPVEESFELGKGCFGLDQCQARRYTAIRRHIVPVMDAFAVCAVCAVFYRWRRWCYRMTSGAL